MPNEDDKKEATVAYNCYGKNKIPHGKNKTSRQNQKPHGTNKIPHDKTK